MNEVQPVRTGADPVEDRIAEQPTHHRSGVGDRGDDGKRREPGQQEPAAEQRGVVDARRRPDQLEVKDHPDQPQQSENCDEIERAALVAQRAAHHRHRPPEHREPGPEHDAAAATERAEVEEVVGVELAAERAEERRRILARVRRVERGVEEHRRRDRDQQRQADQPHPDLRQALATATEKDQHHEWPDQIELLLDRQRPQMAQRHEVAAVGIPVPAPDLEPVADVEDRREHIAAQLAERIAQEQCAIDGDPDERQIQRREQAPQAPAPEPAQRDQPSALVFRDEQQRDQVAADDEEDLDAEKATAEPLVVGVPHHHRDDSERAHAVEAGQIRHTTDL